MNILDLIKEPNDKYEADMQAEALYLLARNAIVLTGQISKLEDYFDNNVKNCFNSYLFKKDEKT